MGCLWPSGKQMYALRCRERSTYFLPEQCLGFVVSLVLVTSRSLSYCEDFLLGQACLKEHGFHLPQVLRPVVIRFRLEQLKYRWRYSRSVLVKDCVGVEY